MQKFKMALNFLVGPHPSRNNERMSNVGEGELGPLKCSIKTTKEKS